MNKKTGYFPSSNGTNEIKYFIYEPEDIEPKAMIQLVHGMEEHVERYEPYFEYLTGKGYLVYGDNHLGHKGSVFDDEDLGYFAHRDGWKSLVKDEHRLTKIMKKAHPELPLFIYGHSMGSFITRVYITKYRQDIDGAIISGTSGSNPALKAGRRFTELVYRLRGERHKSKLVTALMFGSYNSKYKTACDHYAWLTRDESVVKAYHEDEYCGFGFTTSAYLDLMSLLDYVTQDEWYNRVPDDLPLLFIGGSMDPVGGWGDGYLEIDEKFSHQQMEDITVKLYPDMRHELHNEIGKEQVWSDVNWWINAHL